VTCHPPARPPTTHQPFLSSYYAGHLAIDFVRMAVQQAADDMKIGGGEEYQNEKEDNEEEE